MIHGLIRGLTPSKTGPAARAAKKVAAFLQPADPTQVLSSGRRPEEMVCGELVGFLHLSCSALQSGN